jgi:hypothetical protein
MITTTCLSLWIPTATVEGDEEEEAEDDEDECDPLLQVAATSAATSAMVIVAKARRIPTILSDRRSRSVAGRSAV